MQKSNIYRRPESHKDTKNIVHDNDQILAFFIDPDDKDRNTLLKYYVNNFVDLFPSKFSLSLMDYVKERIYFLYDFKNKTALKLYFSKGTVFLENKDYKKERYDQVITYDFKLFSEDSTSIGQLEKDLRENIQFEARHDVCLYYDHGIYYYENNHSLMCSIYGLCFGLSRVLSVIDQDVKILRLHEYPFLKLKPSHIKNLKELSTITADVGDKDLIRWKKKKLPNIEIKYESIYLPF